MKINTSLLKLIIRLTILMILFVVLFLISAFLYSARYWPDIYNYVNANITIRRIPTLSELNLTIIEVEYVTEMYSTTDFDYTDSTSGFDTTEDYAFTFDEFDFPKTKVRRNAKLEDMGKDYGEVPRRTVVVDYFFMDEEGNTKIIKDLVDESKLTTVGFKDVEVMGGSGFTREQKMNVEKERELASNVFPWVAAIFLKNESKGSQFDYFCDGAVMSDRAILTSARCVYKVNGTYDPEDFIVILGKTSLQTSGDNEKILRVKEVIPHKNFTLKNGDATNDLAILILEEPVTFNEAISIAFLDDFEELSEELVEATEAVTTAWSLAGDLTLIYFVKEKSKACGKDNKVENTFCATYGNVPFCPSYGGLHVVKRLDKIYLHGIRTGDPINKGYCINRNVYYTSLQNYNRWILESIENKDD